ncbi:MAG: type IV pilus modification protein PilV [Betaproteobacteria bacterium RBG_16_64_18]|nr:MAG: type IV pilus modification protein PilV [Betaproteobacteria bacterium RBG_16_64_18]
MLTPSMTAMPQHRSAPRPTGQGLQRGVFLIEALLGILIFSLGILSLVAMQTAAVSAQSDARYRIEAANLADQIAGTIWLNLDRTSAASIQTSLATFQLNTSGAISGCAFTGGNPAASADVTAWVNTVTAAGTGLPGTTGSMLQITFNAAGGAYNQVSVTLCWKTPVDTTPHRHTLVSFIN